MRADALVKSWLGLCATTETHRQSRGSTVRIAPEPHVSSRIFPRLAASTGSACHSDNVEMSFVLPATRVPLPIGMGAIQFSLGQGTTEEEIQTVVEDTEKILTW